jgi:hypothetical protein
MKNMEVIQVNQEEVVSAEKISQNDNFIVANTQKINYDELRNNCIIPVFAKDNECTISHSDFIDIVGDVGRRFFSGERISSPSIRISHPIKGRIPEAMGKPVDHLLDHEKTIYYERMAFMYDLPDITAKVGGNDLSLSIGGVRAYNNDSLSGRKGEERFKVFVGFKNWVCTNLCVSTDGFAQDLRVTSLSDLFNRVFQLLTRFDVKRQIDSLKSLNDVVLTEQQFAIMIGRSRLYHYLPQKQKKEIDLMPLSDTQISSVARDYYQDESFCRSGDGNIDLWKVYNLFTSATKSSYIDTFLDRNVGSYMFISALIQHLRNNKSFWYLS